MPVKTNDISDEQAREKARREIEDNQSRRAQVEQRDEIDEEEQNDETAEVEAVAEMPVFETSAAPLAKTLNDALDSSTRQARHRLETLGETFATKLEQLEGEAFRLQSKPMRELTPEDEQRIGEIPRIKRDTIKDIIKNEEDQLALEDGPIRKAIREWRDRALERLPVVMEEIRERLIGVGFNRGPARETGTVPDDFLYRHPEVCEVAVTEREAWGELENLGLSIKTRREVIELNTKRLEAYRDKRMSI